MISFKRYLQETALALPAKGQTLGMVRRTMPQVSSGDVQDFIAFAKTNKVSTTKQTVAASRLKATQSQFNRDKIQAFVDAIDSGTYKTRPVLISADNYVVDGHHRWLAHRHTGMPVEVIRFDLEAKQLIDLMHEYPKSYTKKLNEGFDTILLESGDTCAVISREHMSAFEKLVDKLFAKFNIDFDFTKHFRERMSDERNKPCIDLRELGVMIQKIYKKVSGGQNILAKHKDAEAVIKDIQSDLNMPVAIEYDRKKDELTVIGKTIMRKKNFTTPNPVEKV
jgi:hypothetical protein